MYLLLLNVIYVITDMKNYIFILLLIFAQSVKAGTEEFAFYTLQVTVLDNNDQPVSNSYVKAYSDDWPLTYPDGSGFERTEPNGICSFHIPRGNWTIIAGGGSVYNTAGSGKGLFLTGNVSLQTDTSLVLQPDHAIRITFKDRSNATVDADRVYIGIQRISPNCCMPDAGRTNSGQCLTETNSNEDMTFFLRRDPTPGTEGYYIFADHADPTHDIEIQANDYELYHIHFDGRGPDDMPGTIQWFLYFPYQDLLRQYGHTFFNLQGEADAYFNMDFINTSFISKVFDSVKQSDINYFFQYKGLDFLTSNSVTLAAGGPLIRNFKYAEIAYNPNLSQFLLGPVWDAHGNELRNCWPVSSQLIIRNTQGQIEINETIENMNHLSLDETFDETFEISLDWDLGPYYQGQTLIEGTLGDPNFTYEYYSVESPHFNIHLPDWYSYKAESIVQRWEDAYAAMAEMIGVDPVVRMPFDNFYVHPLKNRFGANGTQVNYNGLPAWHPEDPASLEWEATAWHEFGHRIENDVFDVSPYFPIQNGVNHRMGEAVAEMLKHYAVGRVHGEKFMYTWHNARAHRFFSYQMDPANAPLPQHHNIFFILESYLPKYYGEYINHLFFRKWIDACNILHPLGYQQEERVAALYSTLAGNNLTWLFNLAGFELDESGQRVADAMVEIATLASPYPGDIHPDGIVNILDLAILAGQWLNTSLVADYSLDNEINTDDLLALSDAWLSTPRSANWNAKCDVAPDGGDFVVNLIDFSVMAKEWTNQVDMSADIYPAIGDGQINFKDFAVIANYWLTESTP